MIWLKNMCDFNKKFLIIQTEYRQQKHTFTTVIIQIEKQKTDSYKTKKRYHHTDAKSIGIPKQNAITVLFNENEQIFFAIGCLQLLGVHGDGRNQMAEVAQQAFGLNQCELAGFIVWQPCQIDRRVHDIEVFLSSKFQLCANVTHNTNIVQRQMVEYLEQADFVQLPEIGRCYPGCMRIRYRIKENE